MSSVNYSSAYSTTGGTVTIYSTSSTGTILNSNAAYSNYGINNGSYTINTAAASSAMWSSTTQAGLNVTGDSTFDGDITIKGRSLEKLFNNVERRLAILQPNPKKLEKFEALQKAYDHYKLLEALLHEEDKDGS